MNLPRHAVSFILLIAALSASTHALAQGPPFQVDDPVPVDFKHYEFYIFGVTDGTPIETDHSGPAFEFNWGAVPRVQLHAVLPWGGINPSDDPASNGLLDMEFGAKIALIKESRMVPQIGTFTMIEVPTGNADKGLGVGKAWYKLPLWMQKNFGKWLVDGGAGETVVPQTDFHNFPYGGLLVKREVNKKLDLAAEIFAHGGEGSAPPQRSPSTMLDAGGYWHLKGEETMQLLFAYGHSIAGQTENYAYLGLYWTWGKDDKKSDGKDADQNKAFLIKSLYSGHHMQHGF